MRKYPVDDLGRGVRVPNTDEDEPGAYKGAHQERGSRYDALYTDVHPDYFEVQARDRWYYERLWGVLLKRLGKPQGRLLLDFGSGPGFLVSYAKRLGWLAMGAEPSPVARAHARGLGVYSEPPEDAMHGTYHAIIATEVLEHLPCPDHALATLRKCLHGDGLLAISVPNDDSPLQRLFWGKKKPWIHHTHIHYFNPRTLRALVEYEGFEVVWQGTSFPVELLLVLPIPRSWAWKLSRLWPAPPLLWRLNIGRHCLLVARKR